MTLCVQHVELCDLGPEEGKDRWPVMFPRVLLFDGEPVWRLPLDLDNAWQVWQRPENGEAAITLTVPRADVTVKDQAVRVFGRQVLTPPDPFERDPFHDARWARVTFFASRVVIC